MGTKAIMKCFKNWITIGSVDMPYVLIIQFLSQSTFQIAIFLINIVNMFVSGCCTLPNEQIGGSWFDH